MNRFRLLRLALAKLLAPFQYLRIKHRQKPLFDWFIPLVLAGLGGVILLLLPLPVDLVGEDGLLDVFTGLLQILVGFYIASSAAVATFYRESMDEKMKGDPPTLTTTRQGRSVAEQLTRRRFLSFLFGYLSLLSIVLYFAGAFAELLVPNIVAFVPGQALPFVKGVFLFVYLFFISNLIVTTLLGLFYMTERIHREEPVGSE